MKDGHPALRLDRLVHEPARLALLSRLYMAESADFVYLMRRTGLTQGNLSSHLTKLEAATYVEISKGYSGKRPQTTIRMTARGRKAFETYLTQMRDTLDEVDSS